MRVAFFGIQLEANVFSPVSTQADFRFLEGAEILEEVSKTSPALPKEIVGFITEMNQRGPWEPVPLRLAFAPPGGPVEHCFAEHLFTTIFNSLQQAHQNKPLDAVYIFNHGAMTTTTNRDPDGMVFQEVRRIVGAGVAIVATLDLHANVSQRMVDSVDLMIPYYTNPHIDQNERGAEAARFLRLILTDGLVLTKHFVRLPMISPSVCLLTTDAGPFARWMSYAHQEKSLDVPVVGLIPGFAWSDTEENGFAILVYGNSAVDTPNRAKRLIDILANRIWSERTLMKVNLVSLEEATRRAIEAQSQDAHPICLADVADNPGGGGSSRVSDILRALLGAGVKNVLMGNFHLPELAAKCKECGVGATFHFEFDNDLDTTFTRKVEVLNVSDGHFVGRRGLIAGRTVNLGYSAAIHVDGIAIVVTSRRAQACDPTYFESFGLNIRNFKVVVLKSRGHFRAGFDEFFDAEHIIEVDASGLTSPRLDRFPFRFLPRPCYPLDPDTIWTYPGPFSQ